MRVFSCKACIDIYASGYWHKRIYAVPPNCSGYLPGETYKCFNCMEQKQCETINDDCDDCIWKFTCAFLEE